MTMWIGWIKLTFFCFLLRTSLSGGGSQTWIDCGNGLYVSKIWHCDGDNDCGNFNDEKECEPPSETHCQGTQFMCKLDKHCIPNKWQCDGEKDCVDGSDENDCDNGKEKCTGFICPNHYCLPIAWRCDGTKDCPDGSDEELCPQNDPCAKMGCSQYCRNESTGPQCYCSDGYVLDESDNKTCNDIDECQQDGICSYVCINTVGSYICKCEDGYEMINRTCKATGENNYESVFVSEGSSVFCIRPKSVGSEIARELPLSLDDAVITRVSYDSKSRHLFVADAAKPAIYAINMTSLSVKELVKDVVSPEDLDFDWMSDNLYWVDSSKGTVEVINVNLVRRTTVLTDLIAPVALAVVPSDGFMFIATKGIQASITMYEMDGKNKKILSSVKGMPLLLAVHPSKSILYWADPRKSTISYVNYLNASSEHLVKNGIGGIMSLAVSEDYVYWTSQKRELNLLRENTTHVLQLPGEDKGSVLRRVTYSSGTVTAGNSTCLSGNGGCSYICLTSRTGRTCACSPETTLSNDNVTCVVKECDANAFKCMNGRCLTAEQRCDGSEDCVDGSDEIDCNNVTKECTGFICRNHHCIPEKWRCDGKEDCTDGSDEELCPQSKLCTDSEFLCSSGSCINQSVVCNGKTDCADGSDEGPHCGADPLLIYSTIRDIRGVHLRSDRHFLVRRALTKAAAVDVDPKSQRIYWVEISNRSTVYTAKIDGSDFRNVLSHGLLIPEDIAVDYVANNIYMTDSGLRQVLACKSDGTMCHVLHDTNVDKPRSIALDPDGGLMYWSDWGEHSSGIYRSGMDGSRRISLVSNRIGWPNGIALDHVSNRLYWADVKLSTIEFITLDGSTRKALLNCKVFHPYSLTIFKDSIYWSDLKTFSLESCNKFTEHQRTILATEYERHIIGVQVYDPVLIAKKSNPCWSNDCSHMCLISPVTDFRCACPYGFKLSTDEKTCRKEHGESIFVSEGSSIFYIRPKSVGSDTLTELPLSLGDAMITRVSYDSKSQYMFVADVRKPAIYAINMTSLHMQELVGNFITLPEDLSFDWESNNLYWIDSGKRTAEVININLLRRVAILTDLSLPVALAISPTQGCMFIASLGIPASITMYDMDGKNRKVLYSFGGMPTSLALHPSKSILYWTDPRAGTISSINVSYVNYESSSTVRLVETGVVGVESIAASEEYIYWMDESIELNMLKENVTYVLQLPGKERESVSRKVAYSPGVMTAGLSVCLIDNGGCSYLCLTSPAGRTCACSSEMILFSDNATCVAKKCDDNYFKCVNGRCLPAEKRCDGIEDCADGSDEVGCSNRCYDGDFQCKNGRCILKSWRCDQRDDCGDNSDEQDCPPAAKAACSALQVSCPNGECISVLWRCDGEPDCSDASDETSCNATRCNNESEIRCNTGQCVPVSWACDGTNDCQDGSDEKICSKMVKICRNSEFRCESDGSCIPLSLKCDGRAECGDASDEKNCSQHHIKECRTGMVTCYDGSCIYDYEVCDGHNDCSAQEDESNCTQLSCQDGQLLCPYNRCIAREWICDGDDDCIDGSDEENCTIGRAPQPTGEMVKICPNNEFRCKSDGSCIPLSGKCNGRAECIDASDEKDCSHKKCKEDEFKCVDGSCILGGLRCDGVKQCSDGSDEAECGNKDCRRGMYRCADGTCINNYQVCDRTLDCSSNEDEINCTRPTV